MTTEKTPRENLVYWIVLPFPLPTWNRILAMNPWQRKKVRDFIHRAVSMCIPDGNDSVTLTVSRQKLQSTGWFIGEYLQLIRPKLSKKFR